ncbi:Hint domain-containing protein [Alphaproteobacteria bacterium KMM 3653]|uniref:Hint domain-containing protein n=1 Tax=Harenicola maris TaxID=2841044 RepID=A0AAP2CPW0_9RHOB|nr:Hint domain-containing protein [Harenicola maris]
MSNDAPSPPAGTAPAFTCHVFLGSDLKVTSGANLHDPLWDIEELCLGDIYMLAESAEGYELRITNDGADDTKDGGHQRVLPGGDLCPKGGPLHVTAKLTFMARDGSKIEILHLHLPNATREFCFLPITPVEPKTDYTLIGVDESPRDVKFSDLITFAFLRGTQITMADGSQRPIETLSVGDRLLTRDHGPQPLRWIGQQTVRAVGAYAPVVITKDTLGNASDLIVSQHQRLFVYQQGDNRMTRTAEMLVRAKYLVDDEAVFIRKDGYADYFTLLLNEHEVIYAECIPVESLQLSAQTRTGLPDEIAREVDAHFPNVDQEQAFGTELEDEALKDDARARIFKGNSGS